MKTEWIGLAIQAACQAGRKILELYATDIKVEHKADHSPVTVADKQAHTIIRSILAPSALPLLSEEGRDIPFEQRRAWKYYWLVDPLDGTKEFIKRNGEFTVNIALMDVDRPIGGVIYVPVMDRLYFAEKNRGAYKVTDAQATLGRIKAMDAVALDELIASAQRLPNRQAARPFTLAGSRSHATQELEDYLAQVRSAKKDIAFISAGSSLKFCLVAEGAADQYPRLGPTMEWDTAAGQAVAEAAGAHVLEFEGRTPLRYNKKSLLNPWFIVELPDQQR
ncbi:MAG: 3'(2'),5'-bisphosphate nucleotidase [Desulfobacteraceae bacterium]|nr:MAG: 3'(2'),5'-bisphosphate nucleotidase [Desulfobacteraceae bacterium]